MEIIYKSKNKQDLSVTQIKVQPEILNVLSRSGQNSSPGRKSGMSVLISYQLGECLQEQSQS